MAETPQRPRPQPAPTFKIGDIVRLAGGGYRMKVTGVDKYGVHCQYNDAKGDQRDIMVAASSLVQVT